MVIATFEHKGLKKFYEGNRRYLEGPLRKRVAYILAVMDAAATVSELEVPGFRLHELSGNLRGFWSITVSGNWRITFRFVDGEFRDVDLVDYH